MIDLLDKYAAKLEAQGLCATGGALLGGLDADLLWNRQMPETRVLEEVVADLNINSILFARPAEPYFSIMNLLASDRDVIAPEDSETRTFLHDIPVAPAFTAEHIGRCLRRRKSVVVPGRGVVTYGTVSPEQAFITFSSVCFSMFVKFFTDCYYRQKEQGALEPGHIALARAAAASYGGFIDACKTVPVRRAPFGEAGAVLAAMDEAGRLTVDSRLVDSFFGNISFLRDGVIYISQTGSSLDELPGHIDACPMDGSSTAAVTASSELSAHRSVYRTTDYRAILHGHPRFCVIMSMICDEKDCECRGSCYKRCPGRETSAGSLSCPEKWVPGPGESAPPCLRP